MLQPNQRSMCYLLETTCHKAHQIESVIYLLLGLTQLLLQLSDALQLYQSSNKYEIINYASRQLSTWHSIPSSTIHFVNIVCDHQAHLDYTYNVLGQGSHTKSETKFPDFFTDLDIHFPDHFHHFARSFFDKINDNHDIFR